MEWLMSKAPEYWRLVSNLKHAIDPTGIIAPGRYAPSAADCPPAKLPVFVPRSTHDHAAVSLQLSLNPARRMQSSYSRHE